MEAARIVKFCRNCGHEALIRCVRETWAFRCPECLHREVLRIIGRRPKVLPLHEQKRRNIARTHAFEEALVHDGHVASSDSKGGS